VLTYNVENLFDLDRVALYSDYRQGDGADYGVEPLLNKLEGIRQILTTFNEGDGPEIILFQEFELDRTPFGTPEAAAFLQTTNGQSLEDLLRTASWALDLPAELLLLKYLDDHGIRGYKIAQADPYEMENHPPHKNVVFSRFPVLEIRQRSMLQARDLLVVEVEVDGHELVLLNNHWKSGASNATTEPIRVQNARVVRAELDAILYTNPRADVIIAGDLNSYYNHSAAFPKLQITAVNDVLGANGFEDRMPVEGSSNLYNLWFELDPNERGSEVYRGYWGTLMQMIITPGLYDQRGIQYVDNSFQRLARPGMNVETRWMRPKRWTNYGGGYGFSDHLPIYAKFRTVDESQEGLWMPLKDPSSEKMNDFRPEVLFSKMNRKAVQPAGVLESLSPSERARLIGELFRLDTKLSDAGPPRVQVGDMTLELYSPVREIRDKLRAMKAGDPIRAHADLDVFRGNLQLVIRDKSWLKNP